MLQLAIAWVMASDLDHEDLYSLWGYLYNKNLFGARYIVLILDWEWQADEKNIT